MQGTLYIEDVIFVNVLTNFVICTLTTKSLKAKIPKYRFIISLLLCVLTGVLSIYVRFNGIVFMLLKFVLGFFLCLPLSYSKKIKALITTYLVFMFNTFLMGGICYAILILSNQNLTLNSINSNLTVGVVILTSIIYYYLCRKLIKVFYSKQKMLSYCFSVRLKMNNVEKFLTGFLDTGNNLSKNGVPICIISYSTFSLFYKNITLIELMLKKQVIFKNSEYIKYSTVSGQGSMLVFKPECMEVKFKDNYIAFSHCLIGVALTEVSSSNSFSVLLNSKLF